jgi:hypothetical protein
VNSKGSYGTDIKQAEKAIQLKTKFQTIWLVLSDAAALSYLLRFSRRQHNAGERRTTLVTYHGDIPKLIRCCTENVEYWIRVTQFKERWRREIARKSNCWYVSVICYLTKSSLCVLQI